VDAEPTTLALLVAARDQPGVLYRVTEAIYRRGGNVTYVGTARAEEGRSETQLEIGGIDDRAALLAELRALGYAEAAIIGRVVARAGDDLAMSLAPRQ